MPKLNFPDNQREEISMFSSDDDEPFSEQEISDWEELISDDENIEDRLEPRSIRSELINSLFEEADKKALQLDQEIDLDEYLTTSEKLIKKINVRIKLYEKIEQSKEFKELFIDDNKFTYVNRPTHLGSYPDATPVDRFQDIEFGSHREGARVDPRRIPPSFSRTTIRKQIDRRLSGLKKTLQENLKNEQKRIKNLDLAYPSEREIRESSALRSQGVHNIRYSQHHHNLLQLFDLVERGTKQDLDRIRKIISRTNLQDIITLRNESGRTLVEYTILQGNLDILNILISFNLVNRRHATFAERFGQASLRNYILNKINEYGRVISPIHILGRDTTRERIEQRRRRRRGDMLNIRQPSLSPTLITGRNIGVETERIRRPRPFRHHQTRTYRDRQEARRQIKINERRDILERHKRERQERLDEEEFQREERLKRMSRNRRQTSVPIVQSNQSILRRRTSSPVSIQNITRDLDRLNLQERASSIVSDLERLSISSPNQIQRDALRSRARDRVDSRNLACSASMYQQLIEQEIDTLIREQNMCGMRVSEDTNIEQSINPLTEIDNMNLSQLKQFCRENGIKGFSKFKLKDIKKFREHIRKNYNN